MANFTHAGIPVMSLGGPKPRPRLSEQSVEQVDIKTLPASTPHVESNPDAITPSFNREIELPASINEPAYIRVPLVVNEGNEIATATPEQVEQIIEKKRGRKPKSVIEKIVNTFVPEQ